MLRLPLLLKAGSLTAVLLLLVFGLSMIGGLANERMAYQSQAAASIESSLAGSQALAGMVLTRRCVETFEKTVVRDNERSVERSEVVSVLRALPQTSSWVSQGRIEPRYRGLYKVNSFAINAEEVADWFETKTDPAIAQAVAKAEADARNTPTPAIAPPPGRYSVETQQPIGNEQAQPPLGGMHRAD